MKLAQHLEIKVCQGRKREAEIEGGRDTGQREGKKTIITQNIRPEFKVGNSHSERTLLRCGNKREGVWERDRVVPHGGCLKPNHLLSALSLSLFFYFSIYSFQSYLVCVGGRELGGERGRCSEPSQLR